jgi:hypothetical protein
VSAKHSGKQNSAVFERAFVKAASIGV